MRESLFLHGFFAVLVVLGVFITGCVENSSVNQSAIISPINQTIPPTTYVVPQAAPVYSKSTYGEAKTVVEANNQFAFDLYSNLRNDPQYQKSNIFFSPFSMSSALAMTYEGARGMTAEEIATVFHFPRDDNSRRQQFHDINAGINQNDPGYTLRTANALWAEKTDTFLPEYMQTVRGFYNADATNLDFKNSPDDSRVTINNWVETKTDGKITDLLPSGSVDPSTRLVITNAVFFNGFWKYPFFTEDTKTAKFNISPVQTTDVNMMAEINWSLQFNYNETDQLQIVEMPYTHKNGKELSMLVILPKGDNLTAVENSLDAKNLSLLRNSLHPELVFIWLPRYTIDTQYQMGPVLKSMGMPTTFTDPDFSGMDGSKNLFISTIIHKAYVDVDEKGTKAAAATAVINDAILYGDFSSTKNRYISMSISRSCS